MPESTASKCPFRKKSLNIANRHGLNLDKISSLLDKTDPSPKRGDPSEIWTAIDDVHTNVFGYCLQFLLKFCEPEQVVDILESENLRDICNRIMFMNYIMDPLGFHYTRDELGKLLGKYSDHLNLNWNSLIKTGYPSVRFGYSAWIDWHLTDLYRTKLPASVSIIYNKDGNPECTYKWTRRQLSHPVPKRFYLGAPYVLIDSPSVYSGDWHEELSSQMAVDYEDAPQVEGLSVNDAYSMEFKRESILAAKLSMVKVAEVALIHDNADDLRTQSIRLLQGRLSKSEITFFVQMDYPPFIGAYGQNAGPVCGGLTCMMNVIGAAEAEIRYGLASSTIEALGSLFIRGDDGQAYLKASGAWFSADELARIDEAMKICSAKITEYKEFMAQFSREVNDRLHRKNFIDVSTSVRVPEGVGKEISKAMNDAVRLVEESVSTSLGRTDPTLDSSLAGSPPNQSNKLLFKDEHWEISFNGETCYFKNLKGMLYMSILMRHPDTPMEPTEIIQISENANTIYVSDDKAQQILEDGGQIGENGLLAIDEETRDDVKRSIEELNYKIEETKLSTDIDERDKIPEWKEEIRTLNKYLNRNTYRGNIRTTRDRNERDRKSLGNAVKRAINKMMTEHRDLAEHLSNSVIYEDYKYVYKVNGEYRWEIERG